jgi:hypothetical protein
MAATDELSLLRVQSLGGEGCSLLPQDHFWIASERVVALGRVGPAAGSFPSTRPNG